MKRVTYLAITLIFAFVFASCEKDFSPDATSTPVDMYVKTTNQTTKSSTVNGSLQLSQFLVNIEKIEFDFDDDMYNDSVNYDDVYIYGPFVVDLLSDDAFSGINLGSSFLPSDNYDEVELKMDVSYNSSVPELQNRSVYITGLSNGTPFTFWYNDDFEIELELDDNQQIQLSGSSVQLLIEIYLPNLINSLYDAGLTYANDGNGNGTIEVWPNNPDGNSNLVEEVIEALEDAMDLDDDWYYDDNGNYDDDDGNYDDDDSNDDNNGGNDDSDSDDSGNSDDDDDNGSDDGQNGNNDDDDTGHSDDDGYGDNDDSDNDDDDDDDYDDDDK